MQNVGIVLYTRGDKKTLDKALKGFVNFKNIFVVSSGLINLDNTNYKVLKDQVISVCYNYGIREFLDNDEIEYVALVDESSLLLDDVVIEDCVKASKQTNIECLTLSNVKSPRLVLQLREDINLVLSKEFDGAFCFIKKTAFEKVGFIDERYKHSFEISDFYKRCGDKGITSPFGWFAGVKNSYDNITMQKVSSISSAEVEDDIIRSMKVFYLKYKTQMSDILNTFTKADVIKKLKLLSSRTS